MSRLVKEELLVQPSFLASFVKDRQVLVGIILQLPVDYKVDYSIRTRH